MNLIFHKFSPSFLVTHSVSVFLGGGIVIIEVGDNLPVGHIFNHAHKQEHQGHNDQRDGTHGEQNECQNGKASLARPMGVSKCFVANRLNALAHRFEYGHHGGQCTPMHRYARKYAGGAP